jgi:hypothetical protein
VTCAFFEATSAAELRKIDAFETLATPALDQSAQGSALSFVILPRAHVSTPRARSIPLESPQQRDPRASVCESSARWMTR